MCWGRAKEAEKDDRCAKLTRISMETALDKYRVTRGALSLPDSWSLLASERLKKLGLIKRMGRSSKIA